jgi:protoheme IX farnesyltransferase
MLPVSLWPVALGVAGRAYAAAAIALTLGYLGYTIRFARIAFGPSARDQNIDNTDATIQLARDLLRASVIYLPLLLAAMMLDAHGRLLF